MNATLNGLPLESGDDIADFRGEIWQFSHGSRLPGNGKTGKVVVEDEFGRTREFYDTVFPGLVLSE